jgi:HK97 family phage portal protein
MGLFVRTSAAPTEARSTFRPVTFDAIAQQLAATGGGLPELTEERALMSAAAWSCIDVLCTTFASLPSDVVRAVGGARLPAPAPAVVVKPSPLVSARVWKYQVAYSQVTDGNAFGWVGDNVDNLGNPTRIDMLDPRCVTGRRVDSDGFGSAIVEGKGRQKLWPAGPLWHVPGKVVPAGTPFALSPLKYAGLSISAGIEAEQYGARFFTDGGHPSALLQSDEEIDEPLALRIKNSFMSAIRPGSREPAVMGSGLTYTKVQSDPGVTQYIDLIRFSVEQACRYWRVPPSMIYSAVSGQSVTYANVSQADLHYLKHSVDGYLTNYEEAMTAIMVKPRSLKVNRDALLRADPLERYKLHEMALKNRIRTGNEVRALEDLAPFDDPAFDLPGVPPWTDPAPADADAGVTMSSRDLAEALQKIYLSVGTVVSGDEAREILNREGAGLEGPAPAGDTPPAPAQPQEGTT